MGYYHDLLLVLCILSALMIIGCSQNTGEQGISVTQERPTISSANGISDTTFQTTPVEAVTPRDTTDPDFIIDIAVPEKMAPGTTLLPDNHNPEHPRIIEVNRLGEIVWEYPLPDDLKAFTYPGWDVELLPSGNILTLLPRKGVYEINRDKKVIWSYLDPKVSHDADRLSNGNTLIAFGAQDTKNDAQVKEVNPSGDIVWSWCAKDIFDTAPYNSIINEGWTHTNAVTRLANGNTLVSLRNFNFIVEVDSEGNCVRKIGEGLLTSQHDPAVLPNGNLLVANHGRPHEALEIDANSSIVWRFPITGQSSAPVRDANRLPNGNTLIIAADRIIEVTNDKQVVWQFRLKTGFTDKLTAQRQGFYKAERLSL
jgi:hypothetical protein